jgi:hypothetical protein
LLIILLLVAELIILMEGGWCLEFDGLEERERERERSVNNELVTMRDKSVSFGS